MSEPRGKWSLQHEIKKRKTQELLRTLEAKQVRTASPVPRRPTAPAPQPGTSPKPVARVIPASQRTTQVARVVSAPSRLTRRQRRLAVIATICAVTICLLSGLVADSLPPAQPRLAPLPTTSVTNLVGYLQQVGVPLGALQTFAVPNDTWGAKEEVQFDVYGGRVGRVTNDKGVFVVLRYDSLVRRSLDAFKAAFNPKFKSWKQMQVSNLLVLASPDTAEPLVAEIASHLTQYLIAPYRSFIPTATPGKSSG